MENLFTVASLFAFFSCSTLALFVYLKGRNKLINRLLALDNLAIAFWTLFPFITNTVRDDTQALFWVRMIYIAALFVPSLSAHFMLSLVNYKKFIKTTYLISIALLISLPSPLFIKGITRLSYHSTITPGPLFLVFMLFFSVCCGWPIVMLFLNMNRTTGIRKNQIKYVFFAFLFGFSAAIQHFAPVFTGWSEPFPHDILVTAFAFFLSYSIIKYKALEIDTVIHKTLLWLLSLLLLIAPLGAVYGLFRNTLFDLSPAILTGLVSVTLLLFLVYYTRLKPLIDHFFSRRKYHYQSVLAEMPTRIGSSLDLAVLGKNLFRELKEILYIRSALLLVRPPGETALEEFDSESYDVQVPVRKRPGAGITVLEEGSPLLLWMKDKKKALEKEQVEVDPQYAPVRAEALEFLNKEHLEVLVPIMLQEELIGLLGIGKKMNLQAYRVRDIELLENIGKQIGITIDNALHHGDIVEKERIAEELRLGRQIQMSLLPQESPRVANLAIYGFMQPAREIGGDYYDFVRLGRTNDLGIVVGDVSGKGLAAGLLMAMVKTAIYIYAQNLFSPRRTLLEVNEILDRHLGGEKFMSMLYLIWQAEQSTLTYSSAGHEHILLFRSGPGHIETLQSGGMLLGMSREMGKYLEEMKIPLSRGDKVLLFTDGVTEALNASRDRYGLERLKGSFSRHAVKSAEEILKAVKDDVYAFIGPYAQSDDITLVVMEAR